MASLGGETGETVLITGSSRGLGRALVTRYLLQPNTTVVAAVRNTEDAASHSLSELPRGSGSKVITVKIESRSDSDAKDVVELIRSQHGIKKLDIVVANAGIGEVYGGISQVKPEEFHDMFDVNALGPLRLFQAVQPLLEASNRPRFALIGTPIASISAMEKMPFPMVAYGASKAAAHYLTRKMHCESDKLTAFVLDPGFMQSDLGNRGARHFGLEKAFVPVDTSANFVFAQIEKATRDQTSGTYPSIDLEGSRPFIEW